MPVCCGILRRIKTESLPILWMSCCRKKLIPIAVRRSGIGETRCHSITREERQAFGRLLKDFPIRISGFRPLAEAIVTSGGVSLKEVDPRTMESKLVKGLYFAGELLDVDAYTGGYNLQIAFSTGHLAGSFCKIFEAAGRFCLRCGLS